MNKVERLKEGLEKELSLTEKVLEELKEKDVSAAVRKDKLLEIRDDLSEYGQLGGFSGLSEALKPLEEWRQRLLSEIDRLLRESKDYG